MFLIFVAASFAVLPKLGVTPGAGNFWEVARAKIWTGVALEGQSQFTILHVIFFTWVANAAMHLGMSDLTILRYAKKWTYGFASAMGMFLGHYVAWIASGILYAAAHSAAPGVVAYEAIGISGAVAVVIAGWTTANPTLYRAGMALQVASGWSRWKVTMMAGLVTTLAALFPALVMRLLDFVALYGLILVPMGAVIFADFYLLPKMGLHDYYADLKGIQFNRAAGYTWFFMLAVALIGNLYLKIDLFFLPVPIWIFSLLVYILFSKIYQTSKPVLV